MRKLTFSIPASRVCTKTGMALPYLARVHGYVNSLFIVAVCPTDMNLVATFGNASKAVHDFSLIGRKV